MSGTTTNLAAPPTTAAITQRVLAFMAALTGQPTDYNVGSQVRTMAESAGSVMDMEGVSIAQKALKALSYGTASAYGVEAYPAQSAVGTAVISTAPYTTTSPPAVQDVVIPQGTLLATSGGVQYVTTSDQVLTAGSTGVTVGIIALLGGTAGNAPINSVNTILSNLGYPLFVNNAGRIVNGAPAENPSVTLSRLSAVQAKQGKVTPIAVANAPIGVQGADGTVCRFSATDEPWLRLNNTTAGFTVYIDDGSGSATSSLITAVTNTLNGNAGAGIPDNRPAGVPFTVSAVAALYANLTVAGTLLSAASPSQVQASIITQVQTYFSRLSIAQGITQSQIAATVADAALGYFSSLSVSLFASGSATAVTGLTAGYNNRFVLNTLTINLS